MASKIKLNNNQGDTITLEHSDTISSLGSRVIPLDSITHKVSTIAELRAMTERPEFVYVTGYHTADDGAFGSHFFKRSSVVEADNGGTVIQSVNDTYELQYSGAVNVKWFGAVGTNSNEIENTEAIASAMTIGDNILFDNGIYRVQDLDVPTDKTLHFVNGAMLYPPAGYYIQMNGTVEAGNVPCFFIPTYTSGIRWLSSQDLNIMWFGAKPDSIGFAVQNHYSIQSCFYAFQDGELARNAYGRILIPRGRFYVNQSLYHSNTLAGDVPTDSNSPEGGVNSRRVSIVGEGFYSSVLRQCGGVGFEVLKLQGVGGEAVFSDFGFDQDEDDSTTGKEGSVAIRIDKGSTECYFKNIRIGGRYEIGFKVNNTKHMYFTNCSVDGALRYGLVAENNAEVYATNCLFFSCGNPSLLTSYGYADTTTTGAVTSRDDGTTYAKILQLVNCDISTVGGKCLYSEGTIKGFHVSNSIIQGSSDFINTYLFLSNSDFEQKISIENCGGNIGGCRTQQLDITTPNNLTIESCNQYYISTLVDGHNWIKVNDNDNDAGNISIINCSTSSKTHAFYVLIKGCSYVNVSYNHGINVDSNVGTVEYGIGIYNNVENHIVKINGNSFDIGSDVTTAISYYVPSVLTGSAIVTDNIMPGRLITCTTGGTLLENNNIV